MTAFPRQPAAELPDAMLLQQTMLYFQLEQRHHVVSHGAHTQNRILILLTRKGPLSQADLVRILALEKSWVSRAADKLVAQGWITKQPNTQDRRGLLLQLTPAGQEQATALEAILDTHARSVLARLPGDELAAVVAALRVLHGVLTPPGRPLRGSAGESKA